MELYQYLHHSYTYRQILVPALFLGAVVGGFLAATKADKYEATISLYVQRQSDAASTQYFTYEGYYAQQAAAAYTDNAIKLLTNDEIIAHAAQSAGIDTDKSSISRLRSSILSKKDAPQLIKETVTLSDKNEATRFSAGLAEALRMRTNELNQAGDKKLSIEQVNLNPLVTLVRPSVPLYATAGALLGLLMGLVVTTLWSYVRQRQH